MAKNGNGKHEAEQPKLVEEARAASRVATSKVPGGHRIDNAINDFIARHPDGDPPSIACVINERTAKAVGLLEAAIDEIIAPAVRDLRYLPVKTTADLHPPPMPATEIDANMNALRDAGWGTRLVADINFLRGDYCADKVHAACTFHLREGETIIAVSPSAVVLKAADDSERTLNRVELVLAHREKNSFKLEQYEKLIVEPLRTHISDTERKIADRKRSDENPHSGILYDARE